MRHFVIAQMRLRYRTIQLLLLPAALSACIAASAGDDPTAAAPPVENAASASSAPAMAPVSAAAERGSGHVSDAGRSTAVYLDHLALGEPTHGGERDALVIHKRTFVHSHDCERGVPRWVAWNVNRTHYGDAPRSKSFFSDSSLPAGCRRIVSSDYSSSGYSRGHMVRSEERTSTPEDNRETFLMTNIIPQHQDLNGGPWHKLELYLQRLAQRQDRELYVVAGWYGESGTLKGEGRVTIPARNYKIVAILPRGAGLAEVTDRESIRVIAVDMPNVAGISRNPWRSYVTTVEAIEAATGYDFLSALPDSVERYWESRRYR